MPVDQACGLHAVGYCTGYFVAFARVSAERLGQSSVEERGRIEDAGRDLRGLLLESVAPQAPGDERVVERPHRADVVADRVVPALARSRACAHPSPRTGAGPSGAARRPSLSTCRRCRSTAGGRCSTRARRPGRRSRRARARSIRSSATQKSRLKRRFRSAACFSRSSANAASFQTVRARRAARILASYA